MVVLLLFIYNLIETFKQSTNLKKKMCTLPKGGSLFPLALLYSLYKFKVSCQLIGHFTVVYLVAKPLIWSEAEGDLVVIESSI